MEEREITESERLATDIINNRENPRHQNYWRGESATVRHVDALWDKAFPGEQNGDGPLQARLDAAATEFDKTNAESSDTARAQSEAKLIELWGDQAQTNVQTITDWASQNITPDRAEALNQKYPGLFNDHEFIAIAYEAIKNRG